MRVKKVIPITVDVLDPTDVYKPHMETALKLLKKKFHGGMCFSGCFIVDIISIVKASLPKSDKSRNDGRMLMDVIFEADCIVFVKGEIIPDVMITQFIQNGPLTTPAGIVGDPLQPMACVFIGKPEGQAYKEKTKGPVIVFGASYPIRAAITVHAIAFKPIHRKVYMYECHGTLGEDDIEYLNSRSKQIVELQSELAEIGKGREAQVVYFRKLLYPNRGDAGMPNMEGFERVNITEMKQWDGSFIGVKPTELGYASSEFLRRVGSKTDKDKTMKLIEPFSKYIFAQEVMKERVMAFYDMIFNIAELEYSSIISMMRAYPIKELEKYKVYFDNYVRLKS